MYKPGEEAQWPSARSMSPHLFVTNSALGIKPNPNMDMLLKFADTFSRNAQALGLGESEITREQVQRYLDNLKGRRINYSQIVGWKNARYTVLSLLQNILDGKDIIQDEIDWGRQDLKDNYKESTEFLDKIIGHKDALKPQE